jgi:hypothetical protein
MPVVLVSDTSVLVDLERGEFLDSCFSLPFEFAVPDLLYRRELAVYGGLQLIELGLRVTELTNAEVIAAQQLRTQRPKLSVPDAFAYALASSRGWTLLTGDGALRSIAKENQLPFFGVLWLVDHLYDSKIVGPNVAVSGLEKIAAHPRCRLPKAEIQLRLIRYREG